MRKKKRRKQIRGSALGYDLIDDSMPPTTDVFPLMDMPPERSEPLLPDPDDAMKRLGRLVAWMDAYLDNEVHGRYRYQPLAQDWARVAKVSEEVGEAIDALIGVTSQNPRKGQYGSMPDLLNELADVALTGMYAIQHFTKDEDLTLSTLMDRAQHHVERVQSSGVDHG